MKLRLILKQSWKDYKNKSILYFVFIIFLTIILGVIIGILSFTTFAEMNMKEAHLSRYGGQIYVQNNLVSKNYLSNDEVKLTGRSIVDAEGKLNNYIYNNLNSETKNKIGAEYDEIIDTYIDLLGQYFKGNIKTFRYSSPEKKQESLAKINKLKKTSIDIETLIQINEDLYKNLSLISSELYLLYLYDGLKDKYTFWSYPVEWNIKDQFKNSLTLFLNPNYRDNFRNDEDFNKYYEFNPNEASNFKIYNEKPTSEFSIEDREKIYNGQFVYATPRYLELNNLKIGDEIKIFRNDISYTFLVKGTIMTPYLTTMNYDQGKMTTGLQGYYYLLGNNRKIIDNENDMRLDSQRISYSILNKSEIKVNDDIFNFMNDGFHYSKELDQNGNLKPIYLSTLWNDMYKTDVYSVTYNLLSKILIVIIIGLLLIIFVVFYFMCENFSKLNKETYYNLKAMGCGNITLTLISSISAIIPILISFIFSIFISIAIGKMFAISVSTAYAFSWPNVMLTWKLLIYTLIIIFGIFGIFMFNNFIVITGKKAKINKFRDNKRPSKFIMNIKKIITPLPSKTRIGLTFALSNIAKNIYCFIILSLVFTVILFTFQFNASVNNSANSMVSFAYPDISIKYQSNSWDFKTNYYVDEKGENQISYDFSTDQITSYEEIDSLIKVLDYESLITMIINTSFQNDAENIYGDASNYMITGEFIWNFAESIKTEAQLKDNVIDPLIKAIQMNPLIALHEKEKALIWLNNLENQKAIWKYYKLLQDRIFSLKTDLDVLGIEQESVFPINLLFGKTVIIPGTKNYWSSGVKFSNLSDGNTWGSATSVAASKKQIQNNIQIISEMNTTSNGETITKIKMPNGNQVSALKVEVAKPLADRYGMRYGDTMLMSVESLKTKEISEIRIPIYISGIRKDDLLTKNIYFEKTDYFKVLKETIENRAQPLFKETSKNFEWESYIKIIDKIINNSESNDPLENQILNNSQFSKNDIPINIRYLTLPKVSNKLIHDLVNNESNTIESDRTDLLSYWDKIDSSDEFSKSKNGIYLNSLSKDVWNYRIIRDAILAKAAPFQNIMRTLDQALVGMVLSISLVLISLILFENKNTIILFKTLGYKTREINKYLVTGYLLAAIGALIIALVVNKYIIGFLSPIVYETAGISLIYVLSYSYILYGVILTSSFILLILSSIKIYTKRQNPKEIIK
ncbi:hypothetical protein mflW37_0730 [Mesoplasma florum W37]|uniref:Uncharacterized protein n=1 Tax=Mesoplasma florum TaxID=2151 RepID=A0AAD2JE10_MESFO|nr:ABC transporter permease [Mesoplasma florum]AGY41140.1 hypothetical protein mflW37_0730 [Mesoplasma florum W37]AVN59371.1 ABC transporter permease [Mesoplasma florum]AVN65478.1 hypothetical protein MflW12_0730 [Mesoplasma florum]